MGKKLGILVAAVALLWTGCFLNPDSGRPMGDLQVTFSTTDVRDASALALPPELTGVEHVWLTIKEVQVHTSGGAGWETVAQPNARFDFTVLVNGLTKPLDIFPLPAGKYTQIRLLLAEEGIEPPPVDPDDTRGVPANEVVINGKSFPLKVPSGTQSGIKCMHPIIINENETTEICLEFDILTAIHYTTDDVYIMHPTYRMIDCADPIDPKSQPGPTIDPGR